MDQSDGRPSGAPADCPSRAPVAELPIPGLRSVILCLYPDISISYPASGRHLGQSVLGLAMQGQESHPTLESLRKPA